MERTWKIRALEAGDEPKILELFKIVFGGNETSEHWNWLFPKNPFLKPIVYLAEVDGCRLVGHYSLIPIPFRKHGHKCMAVLSIQSMIHPDFQRQGILKALANAAESRLDKDKVEMGITFLNDKSLHAYTQHFGWTELEGSCPIQFAVIDAKGPVQRVLKVEAAAKLLGPVLNAANRLISPGMGAQMEGLHFHEVKRFSSRVDLLWKSFSANISNTVERSSKYLNWRLAEKPDNYYLVEAELDGKLVGVLATKIENKFGLNFGYIVELFHDPGQRGVAECLVAHAIEKLKSQGCSMATALTLGPVSVKTALDRCGFWKLPKAAMPHGIHFCMKDRNGSIREFLERRQWFLSWSDHDVV